MRLLERAGHQLVDHRRRDDRVVGALDRLPGAGAEQLGQQRVAAGEVPQDVAGPVAPHQRAVALAEVEQLIELEPAQGGHVNDRDAAQQRARRAVEVVHGPASRVDRRELAPGLALEDVGEHRVELVRAPLAVGGRQHVELVEQEHQAVALGQRAQALAQPPAELADRRLAAGEGRELGGAGDDLGEVAEQLRGGHRRPAVEVEVDRPPRPHRRQARVQLVEQRALADPPLAEQEDPDLRRAAQQQIDAGEHVLAADEGRGVADRITDDKWISSARHHNRGP
ncbi:hypothetical protein OV079_31140 [Nannocystis pusilla]|uniref:Uncharacterized protein n=1 Tax=Nannocystis pusilla TaxID=889268 RepID=A0A9X3J0D6_9BACT|nr:hypothetical protein [Nannocystis pusilla]MCY1009940.1 hypothetical protein [Nannocystis pusilla]